MRCDLKKRACVAIVAIGRVGDASSRIAIARVAPITSIAGLGTIIAAAGMAAAIGNAP